MAKHPDELLDLVGQIYDAAGESADWGSVGLPIARAVGAKYAWLMMNDPDHPETCWTRAATGRDIWNYPLHEGPWYGAVRSSEPGSVVLGSKTAPPARIRQGPFFEQWLRKPRIQYACMVVIERTAHNEHFLAFNRVPEAGDFSAKDQRLLAQLAPHIRRAYALHTRLHSPFARPLRADPALDRSSTGAFLLDRYDVVRWMNDAAVRIIDANDGLRLRDGKLRISDAAAARQLADDIERTRITRDRVSARSTAVVRRARKLSGGLPYVFSVTPLHESLSCLRFDCSAATCLLVDDLDVSHAPATLSLRNVFGLTRAEAAVATSLIRGRTNEEIAAERNVSIHTIRTQVKRVLAKTGTHTQAEMVARTVKLARLQEGPS